MPHPIQQESKRYYDGDERHIRETVNEMMTGLFVSEQISYMDVVSQFWDEGQMTKVNEVSSFAKISGSDTIRIYAGIALDHPALPEKVNETFQFYLDPPSKDVLWPLQLVNGGYIAGADEKFNNIITACINRGLLRKVTQWLARNCKTHEQATWLFPSWATICRRNAHLQNIGRAVADIDKPRSLPPVPPDIRMALKYLHPFMAAHELMESFDLNKVMSHNATMCTIRLCGAKEITMMMGELPVEVLII